MKTTLILCDGDFATEDAKTANDLIRFSREYKIVGVIDKKYGHRDAGEVLDGVTNGIPIYASIEEAYAVIQPQPEYLVIGTLPVTAQLSDSITQPLQFALRHGTSIINGLHTFLAEDSRFATLAKKYHSTIIDVRKYEKKLRRFTGAVAKHRAFVLSSVGMDANIGKMTSCLKITEALNKKGIKTEFIATGQIGRMVGTRYFKPIDSIPGPYESGELESLILSVDKTNPDVIVVEGQGCISYPPYGSLNFRHEAEILAESNVLESALLEGAKPDALVLTYAPKRKRLSGFTQYRSPNLYKEIKLNEIVGGAPVIAITINHESMTKFETINFCKELSRETGLPVEDVLYSTTGVVDRIISIFEKRRNRHAQN